MKKIIILMMVLVAGATSTYSINPIDSEVFYKINNETSFNSLMKYLETDSEQADSLRNVFKSTEMKLKESLKEDSETGSDLAVSDNVRGAKRILNEEQYKMYLAIINLTISNNYNDMLLSEK